MSPKALAASVIGGLAAVGFGALLMLVPPGSSGADAGTPSGTAHCWNMPTALPGLQGPIVCDQPTIADSVR